MPKMRDPYLAGWNAAIEAAWLRVKQEVDALLRYGEETAAADVENMADDIRALTKPEPIPDDHWRRVNDGDWDYDPPRKEPSRD
jgi:hypothetical protein